MTEREGLSTDRSSTVASASAGANRDRYRQTVCSRCGRFGCLDLICHGGVE